MQLMTPESIRNWLGLYHLILASLVAGILLLAGNALPLERSDVTSSFEIIIPFLLSQIAVVYRFYTHRPDDQQVQPLPKWLVIAPPLLVTCIMVAAFGLLTVGAALSAPWILPPEQFKATLTFCVALMNVSTVFVMTKYFEAPAQQKDRP